MTQDEINSANNIITLRQMEIHDLETYIRLTREFKDLFRWNRMNYDLLISTSEARIEKCKEHIIQLEKQVNQTK